ncbi:MAG: ergothioneine biosynthesis protein EgtB [Maricaulaceae bacterium]
MVETDWPALSEAFKTVRARSAALSGPLSAEDQALQSMDDVSPMKWHLAHTTWFWETFVLGEQGVAPFDVDFNYLFNSYYEQIGARHARSRRGMLSRPSLERVLDYRCHVDAAMAGLFERADDGLRARLSPIIALGIAHEEQHQELMATDIKHVLFQNPLFPKAYDAPAVRSVPPAAPADFVSFEGGLVRVGAGARGFAFDNERPQAQVWLKPFALADRPVTNAEVAAFITEGGYAAPSLWLSDGWAQVQAQARTAPLYWVRREGAWFEFTLHGLQALDPAAPAAHLDFYEADAIAQWLGARLPTEAEWEHAANCLGLRPEAGVFLTPRRSPHPQPCQPGSEMKQMFGGVWEWTRSDYAPYPGFTTLEGAASEYNGKFMVGQYVLKGGSCATPPGHVRASYRNFFPPAAQWQFSGLRLARTV